MILEINTNNSCNTSCCYCPYVPPETYEEMSSEVRDKVYEICADSRVDLVSIAGMSEPTLYTGLYGMVEFLCSINKAVDLSTNCVLTSVISQFSDFNIIFSLHRTKESKDFDHIYRLLTGINRTVYVDDYRTMTKYTRCGNQFKRATGCCCKSHDYINDRITVDYNGDVLLCCNDWSKSVTFGNVLTDSIDDIIDRKIRYLNDIKHIDDCPCFHCEWGI